METLTAAAPPRFDEYAPIAKAIDYLVDHAGEHPGLDDIAAHIGLSPHHFQRVFKAGAGISPKRFLQYLAAGEAKRAIAAGESILGAAFEAGLSAPSRLHDLILTTDAMTPGAWRRKGEGLTIRYGNIDSPFGRALIGATDKGVCWLSFHHDDRDEIEEMKSDWPAADFVHDTDYIDMLGESVFSRAIGRPAGAPLKIHLQGSNFQLKVWEALLRIPFGETMSYGDVARMAGSPKASRAVGAAVGANSISVLIPCHRVIRASGAIHNYRWGANRKRVILAMEQALADTGEQQV